MGIILAAIIVLSVAVAFVNAFGLLVAFLVAAAKFWRNHVVIPKS